MPLGRCMEIEEGGDDREGPNVNTSALTLTHDRPEFPEPGQ
jgi:hypothetical protein